MGERSYLSIGDVLTLLREEFPDITISKIRFLESRGLLVPERTPSGYRKFYDHDVDRLRWILRQQRENFLPLKVIKGRLEGQEPSSEPTQLFQVDERDDAELEPVFAGQTVNGAAGRGDETAGAGRAAHSLSAGQARALAEAGSAAAAAMRERPRAGIATVLPGEDEPLERDAVGSAEPETPLRAGESGPADSANTPSPPPVEEGGTPAEPAGSASRSTAPGGHGAAHSAVTRQAAAAAQSAAARPAQSAPARPEPAAEARRPEPGRQATPTAPNARGPATSSGPPPAPARTAEHASGKEPSGAGTPSVEVAALAGASLTAAEMAQASGLELRQIEELESYGLIESRMVAGVQCFDEEALLVAKLAASFGHYGVEARHLRLFKHAAERQASLYSQVVMPLLRQRNPEARRRAHDDLTKLSELGASLQACFTKAVLRDLTRG